MRFNLCKVRVLEKGAEVIQHCRILSTNALKLQFEFAEHFYCFFWAASPAGSDRSSFGVG